MGTCRSRFKGVSSAPGRPAKGGSPRIDHCERVIEITVCRTRSVHLSRALTQLWEELKIWVHCPLNAGGGPTSHGQSMA